MINFGTQGDGVIIANDLVLRGGEGFFKKRLFNITQFKSFIERLNVRDFRGDSKFASFLLKV